MLVPCNQSLHQTFDLLQAGGAFVNPITNAVVSLKTAAFGRTTDVKALLSLVLPPIPELLFGERASLEELKARMLTLAGEDDSAFGQSRLGLFLAYSDFLSGTRLSFPHSELSALCGSIPGYAILGGATLMTALAFVQGNPNISSELCEPVPEDPCASLTGVFGTVVGTFNAQLTTILNFLNGMLNLRVNAPDYITQIQQFLDDILARLTMEITNLIAMVMKALHYGFAKILDALKLDPCVQALLQAIGTNALRTALQI